MHEHYILGVHVTNRTVNSVEVQKVFSEYGCYIKTRVGLHDVDETGGMCGFDRHCRPGNYRRARDRRSDHREAEADCRDQTELMVFLIRSRPG